MAVPKILIIEDEPVHLNVMKAKLEYEGYAVAVATDGAMGYQMAKDEKPDLVLLDIILPKMDGFEVLGRLKEDGITIPVIVVSNSGQPVEVDKALKMGARDYLVKAEFNPADVLEKVEKILGRSDSLMRGGSVLHRASQAEPVRSGPPKVGEALASSPPSRSGRPAERGGKTNILIVEDDKFLRDLIVQKLKREGFLTQEALDGEEGLKLVGEQAAILS